ncbi:MAG TPA: hypothetical protein VLU47_01075, partial [Blastocatellia bacterium]|nr:hypothetical protein [Blastocatellia bacterium]
MTINATATDQPGQTRMRKRLTARTLSVRLGVLLLLVVALIMIATAIGSEHVSIVAIIKMAVGRADELTPEQRVIISGIRLPRVLMAVVV